MINDRFHVLGFTTLKRTIDDDLNTVNVLKIMIVLRRFILNIRVLENDTFQVFNVINILHFSLFFR